MPTFAPLISASATLAAVATVKWSTAGRATLRAVASVSKAETMVNVGGVWTADGRASLVSVATTTFTNPNVTRRGQATLSAAMTLVPTYGANTSLESLVTQSSDYLYASSSARLAPFTTSARDPIPTPTYSIGSAAMRPFFGDAECLTGQIARSHASLFGLRWLGSNKPYAGSEPVFTVTANVTGFKSNATGATWTLTNSVPSDGLAHLLTIKNDSATDHSAKTVTIVGYDANGFAQTEVLALPAGSATVTSTKFWSSVTSITPSATIGADTMDIGWSAVNAEGATLHSTNSSLHHLIWFANDGLGPNAVLWTEYVGFYDDEFAFANFSTSISDTMTMTDTLDIIRELLGDVISDSTMSATLVGAAEYGANIVVTVAFYTATEDAPTYVTWVINAETGAASQYDGYEFKSFFTHNELHYGVTDGGIYLLSGDTDNGAAIASFMLTGKDDFDDSMLKRVPYVYVGAEATDGLTLTTHTDGDETHEYPIEAGDTLGNLRAKIGMGLRSRYWQFELRNISGGGFSIDTMEPIPTKQDRRMK